jgi:predicted Ser/Thr protein kinase
MNSAPRPLPKNLGKYEVRREVGRGGMGVVYEGFDPVIGRRVALKTFINEFFDGTQADNLLTRLRREAQAAGRLSHPNIIAVYDYGEDTVKDAAGAETSTAFIAMEFIEGRSLESYFDAAERFPMSEIERIMSELLDALDYSHSHGVVHRDIKPANIILLADGTVKVADFGVARIESSTLTQVGTVLGSPSYMSPEQFMAQTVDGRSDLYSAGVVLYRLLTAEVPFTGGFTSVMHRVLNDIPPPPSALNVQVPQGFDAVLRRAMAKRPDQRYQTAGEFKDAIHVAMAGAPGDAAAPGALPSAAPGDATLLRPAPAPSAAPAQRRALPPAALFAGLAVLVAAVAGAYFLWGPRSPSGTQAQQRLPPPAAAPIAQSGDYAVISAVGMAKAADPAAERLVWVDARRQLVAKAAALYVEPSSLNANYGILRTKLLQHSDDFITGDVQQQLPQTTRDGVMLGVIRASVNVRDVQKSLNQISRDERVEFIRNNGNPRISVTVSSENQPSAVAENLLKERIRSFGFVVVDDATAKPPADFHVAGDVQFKKLSAKLPASGLTIEKFVITSWTVKAIDTKTGEEIYHNTAVPEKQSWATQELALQDVGRLIGEQFTKSFFLQYFDFKPKKARLRFSGLPPAVAGIVLAAVNASLVVLNAAPVQQEGSDIVIDTELSGASDSAPSLVQQAILAPLNHKIGVTCFSLTGADAPGATPGIATPELHILYDSACTSAATIDRLQTAPAEALTGAPAENAGPVRVTT